MHRLIYVWKLNCAFTFQHSTRRSAQYRPACVFRGLRWINIPLPLRHLIYLHLSAWQLLIVFSDFVTRHACHSMARDVGAVKAHAYPWVRTNTLNQGSAWVIFCPIYFCFIAKMMITSIVFAFNGGNWIASCMLSDARNEKERERESHLE